MIFELPKDDIWFPDPLLMSESDREDDGCYAVGGDLRPERLIEAYAQGIFPWSDFRLEDLYWYCPMQRFVIFPNELHISHSMRTYINQHVYTTTFNSDFEAVIHKCAEKRIDRPGAWLGPKMIEAYTELHRRGFAYSVEVWKDGALVGGLYGVSLLRGFFGESMFSQAPGASKFALKHLCEVAQEVGIVLIDCQFETPHLKSMGGRYISYQEYMDLIWGEDRPADPTR